jgi:hypothetical protein
MLQIYLKQNNKCNIVANINFWRMNKTSKAGKIKNHFPAL